MNEVVGFNRGISANKTFTAYDSAARTASPTPTDLVNNSSRGIIVVTDISAIGGAAPQIQVTIQGKDPISGNYYNMLVSPVYSIVATNVIQLYPGISETPNIKESAILPASYRILVTHSNADSITYSVSASLAA